MPQDSHRYKALLESKRVEIAQDMARKRNAARIDNGGDLFDCLTRAKERDKAVREMEQSSAQLRQIEWALRRLQEGTFGLCGRCGLAIPFRRLEALPWARLCISCQERADGSAFEHNAALYQGMTSVVP